MGSGEIMGSNNPPPGFVLDNPNQPPTGFVLNKPTGREAVELAGAQNLQNLPRAATTALGKLAEALSLETYLKKAGVPEGPAIEIPTRRENKITYLPQGGIDYGPTKISNERFTARGTAGAIGDLALQEAALRGLAKGAKYVGQTIEGFPLRKIDTALRMDNKMPLTQILKEEKIPASRLMNKEAIFNEAAGLEGQYARHRAEINKIIDSSGLSGNIDEAMSAAQNYVDSLAGDRSKNDVRALLQKDLDQMYEKYRPSTSANLSSSTPNISGKELGGERGNVSKLMSDQEMQVLGGNKGPVSTYRKLKGGGMLEQSANLAEAAQPGLGAELLNTGQKQSSIIDVADMLRSQALADAGKTPLNAVGGALVGGGQLGAAAGLEGIKLMKTPGVLIGVGRGLQYGAEAMPKYLPSTWLELYKNQQRNR